MYETPLGMVDNGKRRVWQWLGDRWGRALEKAVEDALAKLILFALVLVAAAGATLAILLRNELHGWRLVIPVLLIGDVVAGVGVYRLAGRTERLQLYNVTDLEDQFAQLSYGAEFMRGALNRLQEMIADDVENFEYDEMAEHGVLEPARIFLTRGIGEQVRLSVLIPDGRIFRMRWAAGHNLMSKRRFELPIDNSIAGIAYRRNETEHCPDVTTDPRFVPNAYATRPFRSLIAVPLHIGTDAAGTLNVVSTLDAIFTEADVLFVELLASLLDLLLSLEKDDGRRLEED